MPNRRSYFSQLARLWKLGNFTQSPSFSRDVISHMTRWNQLRAGENDWWIIKSDNWKQADYFSLWECSFSRQRKQRRYTEKKQSVIACVAGVQIREGEGKGKGGRVKREKNGRGRIVVGNRSLTNQKDGLSSAFNLTNQDFYGRLVNKENNSVLAGRTFYPPRSIWLSSLPFYGLPRRLTIVNRGEWLWNPTKFFVVGFCSLFLA